MFSILLVLTARIAHSSFPPPGMYAVPKTPAFTVRKTGLAWILLRTAGDAPSTLPSVWVGLAQRRPCSIDLVIVKFSCEYFVEPFLQFGVVTLQPFRLASEQLLHPVRAGYYTCP